MKKMNWAIVSFLKRGAGICLTSQDETEKERCYKTLEKGSIFHILHLESKKELGN